jgi:sirohydrochlorin cobaltochelatase
MMEHGKAVVLFGHGARDPEWAGPMRRTAAQLQRQVPQLKVALAFMEFMHPTLDEAVDALVAEGVTEVAVVPMFLAQGGHLKRDVPLQVEAARSRHPALSVTLATAVGEDERVIAAMAACAVSALQG